MGAGWPVGALLFFQSFFFFRGLKGSQSEDKEDDPFLVIHPNYNILEMWRPPFIASLLYLWPSMDTYVNSSFALMSTKLNESCILCIKQSIITWKLFPWRCSIFTFLKQFYFEEVVVNSFTVKWIFPKSNSTVICP